jgi:hypothetical protein
MFMLCLNHFGSQIVTSRAEMIRLPVIVRTNKRGRRRAGFPVKMPCDDARSIVPARGVELPTGLSDDAFDPGWRDPEIGGDFTPGLAAQYQRKNRTLFIIEITPKNTAIHC